MSAQHSILFLKLGDALLRCLKALNCELKGWCGDLGHPLGGEPLLVLSLQLPQATRRVSLGAWRLLWLRVLVQVVAP